MSWERNCTISVTERGQLQYIIYVEKIVFRTGNRRHSRKLYITCSTMLSADNWCLTWGSYFWICYNLTKRWVLPSRLTGRRKFDLLRLSIPTKSYQTVFIWQAGVYLCYNNESSTYARNMSIDYQKLKISGHNVLNKRQMFLFLWKPANFRVKYTNY